MNRATAPDGGADGLARQLLDGNGVDAAWLTEALNRAGFDGRIDAIEATVVGTGQVGENVRCRLTWDSTERDGPASVVVKLASSNETSRAAAAATRTYIREVGFYRDVAASVAIRVPRAHHVSEDRPANRFVLVMEDIAPASAGDQLAGCSLAQAGLAVEAAADLHGSTWGRGDLAELDWIDPVTPERRAERDELFAALHTGFIDRYGDRLGDDEQQLGDWLGANFGRWLEARSSAECLVHGDFRLDNMLFGSPPAPPLTTVDWQTVSLGEPLGDVAYFLSGSLEPAQLRTEEQGLLDRYRARLAAHGVQVAAGDVWDRYRLGAPAGYVMAVIASQLVGRTDRGDDMFMVMAAGSATQAVALDTAALVA